MLSLTDAIQNFYTFIISIAGVIAFGALILGGILYLTSTGKPEKLAGAKKQILAAFFGIIILFSSYLILRTISPELVSFQIPRLKKIIFSPLDLPSPKARAPKLFGKIKEIAEGVKMSSESIKNTAEKIQELTDDNHCDCKYTQSLCFCAGGGSGDSCEPRRCYAGPGNHHPCQDFFTEIKENQQRIIAWKDEILYYRNRALAEEKDLKDEIEKVLEEKIKYYQENINIETDKKVIEYFEDQIKDLEEEKGLKQNLAAELKKLADSINEIEPFTLEIAILPDKCLYDERVFGVNNKCNAHCKGGCHDIKEGCQPDECDGGNPCPVGEINDQLLLIQGLRPKIDQTCEEILIIIDDIIKFKTISI